MNFQYSIYGNQTGKLMIYDISGKFIEAYKLHQGVNNQLHVNMEEFANGIYYYQMLVNKDIKKSDKIVIIK